MAKIEPDHQPMRRKSKRAISSLLPHMDATAPKRRSAAPTLWHRFRSAIAGLFVSKRHADANPSTTIRERVD